MTVTPALRIEQLRKIHPTSDGRAGGGVQSATFDIAQGELFTLLGPSGCGKTTTLRAIAGLEAPDAGRIEIGGREVFNEQSGKNVALHDREIGMVFQSYAIWPHMTVFENAAYPLRVSRGRRYSQREIVARTSAVLDRVGLGTFAARPATQLSGGQQQRLALARALAREPRILLLDEPLSNLDAQLREQMRLELKRLQQETGVTAIYVTHDQSEALAISDRIAVMRDGMIVQVGKPKDIYQRPASEFVANFVGRSNLFRGTVAEVQRSIVHTSCGAFACTFPGALPAGAAVSVLVRPESISITKTNGAMAPCSENQLSGRIVRETYLGETVEYLVAAGACEVLVRASSGAATAGDEVHLSFDADQAIAIAG